MKTIPQGVHITVSQQHRKCGKVGCKIDRETKGHGPYFYAYFRVDGKLHSCYLGRELPAAYADLPKRHWQRRHAAS